MIVVIDKSMLVSLLTIASFPTPEGPDITNKSLLFFLMFSIE